MTDDLTVTLKLAIAFHQLDAGGKRFVSRTDLMAIVDQLCNAFGQDARSPKRHLLRDAAEHFWTALARTAGIIGYVTLDREQYIDAMRRLLLDDHRAFDDYLAPMMIAMLSVADFDDDGFVDREGFCAWQIIMGTRVQDVATAFRSVDGDGDGRASIEEIMAAVYGFYASSDPRAFGNRLFGPWKRTTLNSPTV